VNKLISVHLRCHNTLLPGHCGACRRKWRLLDTDLCPCGGPRRCLTLLNPVPDKTEWRLISATLGWRRCFVADQLWLMTHIREEECNNMWHQHQHQQLAVCPVIHWRHGSPCQFAKWMFCYHVRWFVTWMFRKMGILHLWTPRYQDVLLLPWTFRHRTTKKFLQYRILQTVRQVAKRWGR